MPIMVDLMDEVGSSKVSLGKTYSNKSASGEMAEQVRVEDGDGDEDAIHVVEEEEGEGAVKKEDEEKDEEDRTAVVKERWINAAM